MNKKKAGEELVSLFNKSHSESRLSIQLAMLYVGQAANMFIRNFIWQRMKEGDFIVPHFFLKEYTETVIWDADRSEWYINLPVRTLDLLGTNNRGIYHVYPEHEEENLFIPTPTGFLGMYKGLDSSELEGINSYRLRRDKLYINKTDVGQNFKVSMNLIVDNNDLSISEEMSLPPDGELEVMQLAMNLAKVKMGTPEDSSINNLSN